MPRETTDQDPLPSAPSVDVYSATPPPARAPGVTYAPSAKPPQRLASSISSSALDAYRKNGRIELPAPLDLAALARAPGQPAVFTVRTRVSEKRESADSNPITLRLYPPPQPVGAVRAMVEEDAIQLEWAGIPDRTASGAPVIGYRVYRSEVAPPSEAPASAAANPRLSSGPELLTPAPIELSQTSYRDTRIELDHAYSYIVRSLAEADSEMLESSDSQPLVVYARDIFPPAAPIGLEGIVTPAAAGAPPYVDLAWAISLESDLAGYFVYRAEQPGAAGVRLNSEPLPAPTYRDVAVVPGRQYFYRVTAVDRDGNESSRSAEIRVDLPGEAPAETPAGVPAP